MNMPQGMCRSGAFTRASAGNNSSWDELK
jgi:hypothetical protein